ncbi:MAG: hypothetical protein M5R41_08980 [Bacteroidia bacterium]|nr:hypothetical protein [Bacteroidia bacterium]
MGSNRDIQTALETPGEGLAIHSDNQAQTATPPPGLLQEGGEAEAEFLKGTCQGMEATDRMVAPWRRHSMAGAMEVHN